MLVSHANAAYGMSSLIVYAAVPSSPLHFRCTCFHPCFEKKKKKVVLASPCSHLFVAVLLPGTSFLSNALYQMTFCCHFYWQLCSRSLLIWPISFAVLCFFLWLKITAYSLFFFLPLYPFSLFLNFAWSTTSTNVLPSILFWTGLNSTWSVLPAPMQTKKYTSYFPAEWFLL